MAKTDQTLFILQEFWIESKFPPSVYNSLPRSLGMICIRHYTQAGPHIPSFEGEGKRTYGHVIQVLDSRRTRVKYGAGVILNCHIQLKHCGLKICQRII